MDTIIYLCSSVDRVVSYHVTCFSSSHCHIARECMSVLPKMTYNLGYLLFILKTGTESEGANT